MKLETGKRGMNSIMHIAPNFWCQTENKNDHKKRPATFSTRNGTPNDRFLQPSLKVGVRWQGEVHSWALLLPVCLSHIHLSTLQKFQLAEGVSCCFSSTSSANMINGLVNRGADNDEHCERNHQWWELERRRGRRHCKRPHDLIRRRLAGVIIRYTTWRLNARPGGFVRWFGDPLPCNGIHLFSYLLLCLSPAISNCHFLGVDGNNTYHSHDQAKLQE